MKSNPDDKSAKQSILEKAASFLKAVGEINHGEKVEAAVEAVAKKLLGLVSGQSICVLSAKEHEKSLLPRMIIGKHLKLLKACYYNTEEGVAKTVIQKGNALKTHKGNNYDGDILLQELARNMDFQAVMAAPVKTGPRHSGMVVVFGSAGVKKFEDIDIALLKAFANILSLMWRNRSLQNKLDKSVRELDSKEFHLYTVYQVSKALSSITDMEQLTSILADMLVEILNVSHSIIFLSDQNEEKMHAKAYRFLDPSKSFPTVEITVTEKNQDWLLAQNFESRIIVDFDDKKLVEAFPDIPWIFKELEVEAAVPMVYNCKLVGFLALGKKYLGEKFESRDWDFLSTIAPMAASAISNTHLYELAILDGLTKVYLGRYFRQRCQEEIKRARRYKQILSIVMWDIDHFKKINDTYGHLAGDAVLSEVAAIFRKGLRQGIDMVARYGGEEFAMLLPDTPAQGAMVMAERLRRTIEETRFWNGKVKVTVTGGISAFPEDGTDYLSLIEQADVQLYRGKRDGRNQVRMKSLGRA